MRPRASSAPRRRTTPPSSSGSTRRTCISAPTRRLPRARDGPLAGAHSGGDDAQRDRQPQRLVHHAAGRGRRCGHRRASEGRHRAARHGFQSAPRREQPAGLHHGCRRTQSASPLLLRVGRRRPHGAAVRELEGGVPRAACRRHPARLAGALYRAALPEAVQPPHRPLRAGRHHVEHLLGLGARPHLPVRAGAGVMSRGCCRVSWSSPRGRSRRRSRSTR